MKKLFTLLTVCLLSAGWLSGQELANFSRGPRPVVSPEIQGDSVSFRLKADYATLVKLSASWLPNRGGVEMKRGENNVWEVKLPLPEP